MHANFKKGDLTCCMFDHVAGDGAVRATFKS